KEPITHPTLTDVEFNDAFAVSYLQPRINLPQLGGNNNLDVHIYPNPASKTDITRIAISSAWKGELIVEVKDAVGRTVITENTMNLPSLNPNQTLDLPLGQFSPGTYLCQIRVKNLNGEVLYRTLPFVIKN
ncbi:MAG: T9SS C-terminal target domain-containing protein, partial [Bacteroidetes bacterium]|nr:T9SS C-terminal target domain-containing protein [Bacteroidota bacterium]